MDNYTEEQLREVIKELMKALWDSREANKKNKDDEACLKAGDVYQKHMGLR